MSRKQRFTPRAERSRRAMPTPPRAARRRTMAITLAFAAIAAVSSLGASPAHAARVCISPVPPVSPGIPGPPPVHLGATSSSWYGVELSWETGVGCWEQVGEYRVLVDGVDIGTVPASSAPPLRISYGFEPGTLHEYTVIAIDDNGTELRRASADVKVPPYTVIDGTISGAAVVRSSTLAALSLGGSISMPLAGGSSTGTLTLAPGRLTMRVAGLFPVTATATFDNTDPTATATYGPNAAGRQELAIHASRGITFSNARFVGVDLLAGKSCATATPASLDVATTDSVSGRTAPFTMTGTIAWPKSSGCGVFGSLIAPTAKTSTVSLTVALSHPTTSTWLQSGQVPQIVLPTTPTPTPTPTPVPVPTPTPTP